MVCLLVLLYPHQVLHLVAPGSASLTLPSLHGHFLLLLDRHFLHIFNFIVVPASLALLMLGVWRRLILGRSQVDQWGVARLIFGAILSGWRIFWRTYSSAQLILIIITIILSRLKLLGNVTIGDTFFEFDDFLEEHGVVVASILSRRALKDGLLWVHHSEDFGVLGQTVKQVACRVVSEATWHKWSEDGGWVLILGGWWIGALPTEVVRAELAWIQLKWLAVRLERSGWVQRPSCGDGDWLRKFEFALHLSVLNVRLRLIKDFVKHFRFNYGLNWERIYSKIWQSIGSLLYFWL